MKPLEILDEYFYPITIIKDRYNGAYSGARWLVCHWDEIPEEIGSGDSEEMEYWDITYPELMKCESVSPIGKGDTIERAAEDFINGMIALIEKMGTERVSHELQRFHKEQNK